MKKIVLLITVLALTLYSVRLKSTIEMSSDFGRDMLRTLEMWQSRQFTFLGSPLAFASLPGNTVFFTSLSLYIGVIGFLVSSFSPVGAVIPNIVLTTVSIYFFYLLSLRLLKVQSHAVLSTVIYAFSPLTVYYARFFWTPNTLIPLSVFFWYLATSGKRLQLVAAGFLAGVMFHIHYMALVQILLYLLVLLFKREFRPFLALSIGLTLGLSPFLLFEARNGFFLTRSLAANLQAGAANTGTIDNGSYLYRLTSFFGTLLGFRSAELSYDNFMGSVPYLRNVALFSILLLMIREVIKTIKDKTFSAFTLTILLSMFWVLATKNAINIRYLFSLYAILVIFAASMLIRTKSRLLIGIFLTFMLGTTYLRVSNTIKLSDHTIPIRELELAADIIVQDNFQGSYNLTENLTGDAKATPLRFFVLRDAAHKPQAEGDYYNLDAVYVLAKTEADVHRGMRWEFLANPTMQLAKEWPAGEINVYKFLRH